MKIIYALSLFYLLKIIKFINVVKRSLFIIKVKSLFNEFFLSVYNCASFIILNFVTFEYMIIFA